MSELRYQWSKMSPDRSEQVVVRTDSYDEFIESIKLAKGVLPQVAFPNDSGPIATAPEKAQVANPVCGIHQAQATWKTGVSKKTGKPYAFWSCSERNADGSFCTFKFDR